MPDYELTSQEKYTLSELLTDDLKNNMLSGIDMCLIQDLGEEVLVDALRLQPKITDVKNAPPSFIRGVNRLVMIALRSEEAFQVIGEAVIIAREYTNQTKAFTKE